MLVHPAGRGLPVALFVVVAGSAPIVLGRHPAGQPAVGAAAPGRRGNGLAGLAASIDASRFKAASKSQCPAVVAGNERTKNRRTAAARRQNSRIRPPLAAGDE